MGSLWPGGAKTKQDTHRYAHALFGICDIEDLLSDAPFDSYSACFLIRVKGACNKRDWKSWPDLISEATKATVDLHGKPEIIHAQARVKGRRERIYDTLQVTPNGCTCRVPFGADRHRKQPQASSSETKAALAMDKMLMAKFKPPTPHGMSTSPTIAGNSFT